MKMTLENHSQPLLFNQKPNFYILNMKNMNINNIIQFVKAMQFNRNTKFIFIGNNFNRRTLRKLASKFITCVVIIDPATGILYSFTPYKHRMLNKVDTNLKTLGMCTQPFHKDTSFIESDLFSVDIDSFGHRPQHKVFHNESPKVWTSSEISVMYYFSPPYTMCIECENQGIEMDVHLIIMQLINLTGRYHREVIDVLDKRTAVRLNWEKYDILLNSYHFENMDFTSTFVHDYYSWFVPAPLPISKWEYICIIFTTETWVFLTFSLILISVIWFSMNFFFYNHRRPMYIIHNLVVIMRLTVEEDFDFQICHFHQLILYTSIYFFVFMLSLIYRTEYTTILTKNIFEEGINSFGDAIQNGLNVGLPVFRKKLLQDCPEIFDYMEKNYVPCDFSTACLEQTALERNMITATIDRYFNYVQKKFVDRDGRNKLKKLFPPLVSVQLVEVLPQGHVLTPILSKYLGYLRAHGFVNYLMKKYDQQAFVPPVFDSGTIKLTFEHVQTPITLLVMGIIVGTAVFLSELIIYAFNMNQ